MALSFNGLEPVTFGGKDCTPRINTELKMRLSQIKDYNEETDEVLASAFPDDEIYVRDFLKNKMTTFEKQTLHMYLFGGESMVNKVMNQLDDALAKGGQNE